MYYEPNASRSNLTVLTSAHVARISLSKVADREATAESVSFLHDGKEYRALVNKEVIVSAGYAMCSARDTSKTLTCTWFTQINHDPAGTNVEPSYLTSCLIQVQVLELSGIGDPAILREAGVEVAVDLQGVGNNIQEHCNVGLSYRATISLGIVSE